MLRWGAWRRRAESVSLARTTLTPSDQLTPFLQEEMKRRGLDEVSAVEAAQWLDKAGLLSDSETRPGLPLRQRLRRGEIGGGEQRPPSPHGRWYVRRVDKTRHRPGSRIEEGRSTVYVFGELEPRELALFNADEIRVDPRHRLGATVEVIGHGIGFWSPDHSTARGATVHEPGPLPWKDEKYGLTMADVKHRDLEQGLLELGLALGAWTSRPHFVLEHPQEHAHTLLLDDGVSLFGR